MPYRHMTLPELAKHIGMDARELRRLTEKGSFPGQMVNGEWRFHSARLLEYLQHELHYLDAKHIRNLDRAMSVHHDEDVIDKLLAVEAIEMFLPARSRPSVLRELVKLAERTGHVWSSDELVEALEKREGSSSTALAGGFAFPHPATLLEYATAEPLICLARVPHGIPFGAPDGDLTYIFVFLISHDDRQHLLALARLAQMFVNRDLVDALKLTDDPREAAELLLQAEQQVLDARGRK